MEAKNLKEVYELFWSVPGMAQEVKIDLKISRKNTLLLTQIIQEGLNRGKSGGVEAMLFATEESVKELQQIADHCLQKAELVELNERLKQFSKK